MAVLSLPGSLLKALSVASLAGWLSQSHAVRHAQFSTPFTRLLEALALPLPDAAPAALRLWGHSGTRPGDWVAAADPVWLQAGLDKLLVQVPPQGDIGHDALRALFADLDNRLFAGTGIHLQALDEVGYLRGGDGFATATVPATAIAGEQPDDWLPAGSGENAYLSLTSELQMVLHDHPFNQQREAVGRQPVNALWLWGGGRAGEREPQSLPAVFSNDPLLRGYGHLSRACVKDWPGTVQACQEAAADGFVASVPADAEMSALAGMQELWRRGALRQVTLLFADARCDFSRGLLHRLRRQPPAKLTAADA